MILDANSIFLAVKNKKLTVLRNAKSSQLVRYELGNVVWKEVYLHKTMDLMTGLEFLKTLMSVVDKIELTEPDYVETLKTANRYGITFYDAIYVQLAMEHSDTLVTEDKKLRDKVYKDVLSLSEII